LFEKKIKKYFLNKIRCLSLIFELYFRQKIGRKTLARMFIFRYNEQVEKQKEN